MTSDVPWVTVEGSSRTESALYRSELADTLVYASNLDTKSSAPPTAQPIRFRGKLSNFNHVFSSTRIYECCLRASSARQVASAFVLIRRFFSQARKDSATVL